MSRKTRREKSNSIRRPLLIFFGLITVLAGLTLFLLNGPPNYLGNLIEETFTSESPVDENHESQLEVDVIPPEERFTNISIVAVGDIMGHSTQIDSAYNESTDSYDFKPVFEEVKPFLQEGDLTIANLETTLGGSSIPYAGYPLFNAPDEMVDALDYAGFDTIITTNNHSLDTHAEGLKRTVEVIEQKGLAPVGTYDSQPDSRILIKDVQGVEIAILAYTEHLNGLEAQYSSEDLHSMVNIIDEERILSDIEEAKSFDPDLILAYMHWGDEYAKEANHFQTSYAELLAGEGVDIILGSHPHVIQASEFIEVDGNEAFVAYSLGNFVSNQRRETLGEGFAPTEDGVILHLDIQKDHETGETTIQDVEFTPTWVYRDRYEGESQYTYRILPIQSILEEPGEFETYTNRMQDSYEETITRIDWE